jgi:hypothetical protein
MTRTDIVEILLMFVGSAVPAWVLIFRPAWADKLLGRRIITPTWGKALGALLLVGFVYKRGRSRFTVQSSPPAMRG